MQQVLATLGRAVRLDCGLLMKSDGDHGYAGAREQKRLDPWNTWSYDLSSWAPLFTFDPRIPVGKNEKPILIACGGKDPSVAPEIMKIVADGISGPVDFYCLEGANHQLMLFHTEEFSAKVHEWVQRKLEC